MQHDRALVSFGHGVAPLALAGAAMNGRRWTTSEVRQLVARRVAGATVREIAAELDRTKQSVIMRLHKECIRIPREVAPLTLWQKDEARQARISLAGELAAARAERATAPLLRSWPAGVWP